MNITDFPIFERKRWEYDTLIPQYLEAIFNSINLEQIKFAYYSIEDYMDYDIGVNCMKMIRLFVSMENEIKEFKLKIPWLAHDNTFYISDNRYHPLFQLLDRPLVTSKKHIRLTSNTNLALVGKNGKVIIYKKQLPISTFLLRKYTFEELLKRFNVPHSVINENQLVNENLNFPLGDEKFYQIKIEDFNGLNEYIQKFLTFAKKEINKNKQLTFNGAEVDHFESLYRSLFKKNNPEFEEFQYKNYFDPILKDCQGWNKDIREYIIEAMADPDKYDSEKIENKRVRFVEWLLVPLMIGIRSILIKIMLTNNKDSYKRIATLNKDLIINEMYKNGLAQIVVDANLLQDISYYTRITLSGVHGIKPESATIDNRTVKPDQRGVLCPIDTPDGKNVGIVRNLTMGVKLDDRGYFV